MLQPRHRRTVSTGGTRTPAPGPRPAPGSALSAARGVRGALLALAVALLGAVAGLTVGAGPAAAAGSCSGPLAGGQIRVVMVVDPGETGPRGPQATCLVVTAGTSGSKILAQRASELGLPAPRYAGSGLLCGLDGFPATECPVNNGGDYAYWAYFNGSGGSWSFGHDNPFVRRMVDGEIMGWRYTAGSPDGGAPQPRIAPSASLFPPLTPATTAPPAPAPAPPGAPAAGGAIAAGTGGPPPSTDPTAPAVPVDDTSSTVTTTVDPAGTAEGGSDTTTADEELAAAPASSSGSDAGRWVGVAVAVAAVGALAVGAVTRTRTRAGS